MKRKKEGIYQKINSQRAKKTQIQSDLLTNSPAKDTTSQQGQQRENILFKYICDVSRSRGGSM